MAVHHHLPSLTLSVLHSRLKRTFFIDLSHQLLWFMETILSGFDYLIEQASPDAQKKRIL